MPAGQRLTAACGEEQEDRMEGAGLQVSIALCVPYFVSLVVTFLIFALSSTADPGLKRESGRSSFSDTDLGGITCHSISIASITVRPKLLVKADVVHSVPVSV